MEEFMTKKDLYDSFDPRALDEDEPLESKTVKNDEEGSSEDSPSQAEFDNAVAARVEAEIKPAVAAAKAAAEAKAKAELDVAVATARTQAMLEFEAEAEARARATMPELRHRITVGSNPDNNVVVSGNASVEAYHAFLEYLPEHNAVVVKPYLTKAGTFLGEILVPAVGMSVEVGQVLSFGTAAYILGVQPDGTLRLSPTTKEASAEASEKEKRRMAVTEAIPAGVVEAEFEDVPHKTPETETETSSRPSSVPPPLPVGRGKQDPDRNLGLKLGFALLTVLMFVVLGLVFQGREQAATATPRVTPHATRHVRPLPLTMAPRAIVAPTPHPVQPGPIMTVVPTLVVAPPVVAAPVAVSTGGYSCRPGSEVTSCEHVAEFLLTQEDGAPYWDCSGISLDQYREMFTVEDPSGARSIVANTCACQYCEPIVGALP